MIEYIKLYTVVQKKIIMVGDGRLDCWTFQTV